MFLNIVTPCSRPEHLKTIEDSINIPQSNFRWIIVFDADCIPKDIYIPKNCEAYSFHNNISVCGNSQRNHALDMIKTGWVYFQDDDTTLHPDLWDNIKNKGEDFISFMQNYKDGTLRLDGKSIEVYKIDSHNFISRMSIIKNNRWWNKLAHADGIFAQTVYGLSISSVVIPKVLSVYNILREDTTIIIPKTTTLEEIL